jgi:hypothetical protein
MNCDAFRKSIDSYLDAELNTQKSSEFEKHLESCQRCGTELMSFEKCIRLMRKFSKDEDPPGSIRKNVFEKLGCCDPSAEICCPPENKP